MAIVRPVSGIRDVRRSSGGRVQVFDLHEGRAEARDGRRESLSQTEAAAEEETTPETYQARCRTRRRCGPEIRRGVRILFVSQSPHAQISEGKVNDKS